MTKEINDAYLVFDYLADMDVLAACVAETKSVGIVSHAGGHTRMSSGRMHSSLLRLLILMVVRDLIILWIHVFVYEYTHVCGYVSICVCAHTCMRILVCTCGHVCIFVCAYARVLRRMYRACQIQY